MGHWVQGDGSRPAHRPNRKESNTLVPRRPRRDATSARTDFSLVAALDHRAFGILEGEPKFLGQLIDGRA